jgi:hypothetical protein
MISSVQLIVASGSTAGATAKTTCEVDSSSAGDAIVGDSTVAGQGLARVGQLLVRDGHQGLGMNLVMEHIDGGVVVNCVRGCPAIDAFHKDLEG